MTRWNTWTPAEDRRLLELAGTLERREIAARLTAEFGTPRSPAAVRQRGWALDVSLVEPWWTGNRIARLFGASFETVRAQWLETGLLPCRAMAPGTGSPFGEWRVAAADLEAFIRTVTWAYDAERLRPRHPLSLLARTIQQRDHWLYADEAAAYLRLSTVAFRRWCSAGVIPHRRRHVGRRGGVHGAIVVRSEDLVGLRGALAERRRASVLERNRRTARARAERNGVPEGLVVRRLVARPDGGIAIAA